MNLNRNKMGMERRREEERNGMGGGGERVERRWKGSLGGRSPSEIGNNLIFQGDRELIYYKYNFSSSERWQNNENSWRIFSLTPGSICIE